MRSSPRHLQVARAHEGPSWGAQRSRRRPPTGVSGRVIDRRSDARQPRPAAAYEAPKRCADLESHPPARGYFCMFMGRGSIPPRGLEGDR